MRADRIEITEHRDAPAGIGDAQIVKDLFADQFGASVRIGDLQRKRLGDRYGGRGAVDGRR